MLRLPLFRYYAPASVAEAVDLLARAPGEAMVVGGGTDLLPNMKRRQQTPSVLIGLRRIQALKEIANGDGLTLGAGLTLTELLHIPEVQQRYRGLWEAASQIATPHLRNMGTLGGNLCLDTRCNYYDQSYEWRKSIGFCMKKDGDICWVAPSSPRCLAVASSDTAPVLMALGASVSFAGPEGIRRVAVAELYRNDGICFLRREPVEVLTLVHIPPLEGWRSTYLKLRRRGSFDFPVLSVAAAARIARDGTIEAARIVLGAVASRPVEAPEAAEAITGRPLSDAAIGEAAELAARPARPMDNTDFSLLWRKRVTREFVARALDRLRNEPLRR